MERYILEDVKEPEDNTSKAWKTWKNERATAKKVFVASVTDDNVIRLLKRNGWDYLEKNPKVTYDLIKRYVLQVNTASPADLLAEIIHKKREQFDTLGAYIDHVVRIRDQLKDTGNDLSDANFMSCLSRDLTDQYCDLRFFEQHRASCKPGVLRRR